MAGKANCGRAEKVWDIAKFGMLGGVKKKEEVWKSCCFK